MSVLITLIIPLVGVIPSFHQNAMFMEFASYLISIPLKLISLIVSIPFAVFGSIFDLLFKKYPDEPTRFSSRERARASVRKSRCSTRSLLKLYGLLYE